jgi:type IV pilus assembly protein PilE
VSRCRRRRAGFSLVELLVTLAILSIITTFAIGGYRQYLIRANRVDATAALLRIASGQEKYYAQNGGYAGDAELATAPPDGLGITGTERGFYTLAIAPAAGGLAVGYTATATADSSAGQQDDEDCRVFSINERGLRGAETSGGGTGPEITDRCWR